MDGKGWTDEEEHAFTEIMVTGGLERLPAIRLYRRFGCDLKRALKYAKSMGEARVAKDRGGKRLNGRFLRSETLVGTISCAND
jgi:hypothetical protein